MIADEVSITLKTLQQGGVILYPTDTVWGIGCDATDDNAVEKIFKIKQRKESKSLVILVNSLDMLRKYIDAVVEILQKFNKPTTIIYNKPRRLAKKVIANDNTVAIRIVQDKFCKELIEKFEKPIVSTSANISSKPTPKSFKEIEPSIFDAVDYVVNLHQNNKTGLPSAIIRITNKDEIEVIRE
jgi:L-threonylcarbamoyladenylate synthase